MADQLVYEVVQGGNGWQVRRRGSAALVEFPTERQAVRAGVAICLDEGGARLLVQRASGVLEELDPLAMTLETFAA